MIESPQSANPYAKPQVITVAVACLIVGIVIGWFVLPVKAGRAISPQVLKGKTTGANFDASAIGFDGNDGKEPGAGYDLTGAWFLTDGVWSEKSCLTPLKDGEKIEMAVLHPKGGPPADVVAWVKCLS